MKNIVKSAQVLPENWMVPGTYQKLVVFLWAGLGKKALCLRKGHRVKNFFQKGIIFNVYIVITRKTKKIDVIH